MPSRAHSRRHSRLTAVLLAWASTVAVIRADVATAQDFKLPLGSSHLVYDPGVMIVEPQTARWTLGVGMIRILDDRRGRGLVAQATYGGTYHHLAGGVGVQGAGRVGTRKQLGIGLNYHYNMYQSPNARTRIGHQLGWSLGVGGQERTHVLTYRPRLSYSPRGTWALFGGAGGETTWRLAGSASHRSTHASVVAGIYTDVGGRLGWSTGIETVFAGPPRVQLSTSIQLKPGRWLR